jgi:hypothetical protein
LGHYLAVIHYNHKPVGTGRNDFFSQQRTPSAFDEIKMGIHLIGPIHGQVQMGLVIQSSEGNSQLGSDLGSPYGGRDTRQAYAGAHHTPEFLQKIIHG